MEAHGVEIGSDRGGLRQWGKERLKGEEMIEQLCTTNSLIAVIITLLLAFMAAGAGKGMGYLFSRLLDRVLGRSSVTVNVNSQDREDMADDRQHMGADRQHMGTDRDAMARDRNRIAVDRAVMEGHACHIPEDCPKHGEEHERSLQNQDNIADLQKEVRANRELYWKEFKAIRRGIGCITNGLLAKQIIDPKDLPRED